MSRSEYRFGDCIVVWVMISAVRYCVFAMLPAIVMLGHSAVSAMCAASGSTMKLMSPPRFSPKTLYTCMRFRSTYSPMITSSFAVEAKVSFIRIAVATFVSEPAA